MADERGDLNQYNGGPLVGTCVAFLTLSWLAVFLRTYTRAVLIKRLQIDDWLMILSQFIFTTSCIFVFLGVHRGMGRHNDAMTSIRGMVEALKWQAMATLMYIINMMFIKLSIGVFLLRMSVKRVYNYIIWSSLVIVVIWSLTIFFWDIFQCNPIRRQWDFTIVEGSCTSPKNIIAAAYAISAMTIVTDWLYAILPVPMLWKVTMTKQAKATVIMVLGLGIFASIATIIRFRFLHRLQDLNDILYSGTEPMIWTIIEPGMAIIASSLATIRPLLRALRVRGFESSNYASNTNTSAGAKLAVENGDNTCIVRKYGPGDISLKDVEQGYGSIDPSKHNLNTHVLTVETCDSLDWSPNDDAHYSKHSFEDIHGMEALSQENSVVGLAR